MVPLDWILACSIGLRWLASEYNVIQVKVTRVGTVALPKAEGPALYLPTRKAVLIDGYLLYIILKVAVCFLDQYSVIKYAFLFIMSNIDH